MVIAGGDDAMAAAHAAQGGGGFQAQFPCLGHQQIGNFMAFEMAPHVFHRIEFRSVGGQAFQGDPAPGGCHKILHQGTAVDGRSIPQDQYLAWNMTQQVLQKKDDLRALDAAGVDLKVKTPQGQSANDGEALPVEGFLQKRSLPAQGPSARPGGTCAQAAFVDEDDGLLLAAGFFFKAGHCTRRQWRMAFSSRSIARRSGRWQLKPLAPSKRQT